MKHLLEPSPPFPSGNESEQMNPSHHLPCQSHCQNRGDWPLPLLRWSPLCPPGERKGVGSLSASRTNSNDTGAGPGEGLCVPMEENDVYCFLSVPEQPWISENSGSFCVQHGFINAQRPNVWKVLVLQAGVSTSL